MFWSASVPSSGGAGVGADARAKAETDALQNYHNLFNNALIHHVCKFVEAVSL
jgi:hypothetical protein